MKSEHTRGQKFTQIHVQIKGRNNQSNTQKKELISSNSSSVQTWRASGPNFKLSPLYFLLKISHIGPHLLRRRLHMRECVKIMVKLLNSPFPNSLKLLRTSDSLSKSIGIKILCQREGL